MNRKFDISYIRNVLVSKFYLYPSSAILSIQNAFNLFVK